MNLSNRRAGGDQAAMLETEPGWVFGARTPGVSIPTLAMSALGSLSEHRESGPRYNVLSVSVPGHCGGHRWRMRLYKFYEVKKRSNQKELRKSSTKMVISGSEVKKATGSSKGQWPVLSLLRRASEVNLTPQRPFGPVG